MENMFKDNDNNVVRLLRAFEGEVYDNYLLLRIVQFL